MQTESRSVVAWGWEFGEQVGKWGVNLMSTEFLLGMMKIF